ncbi:CBS domain-containing protein [Aliiglaciecola sp. CAU 1673]|uniref:CBS domain-containing protein n=1 Tax=Aliiglaciecola sp. CAU 1673 TaxID=3032595 RepID=UPI0023DA46BD|nr:CBS domain-containing protein [Aliiglaciecola sp. CAU 1673]MDF2178502.1 CBS domain-containing protein [Aliiglaciecola sp. CAU 1673]
MRIHLERFMTKQLVTIKPEATLAEVKAIFAKAKFHHLLVVEAGKLVGVVSDRDLLKTVSPYIGTAAERAMDTATLTKKVHQIMSRNLWVLGPKDDVYDAVQMFSRQRISCIPVVDAERRPVGIISWRDIMRLLIQLKTARESKEVQLDVKGT